MPRHPKHRVAVLSGVRPQSREVRPLRRAYCARRGLWYLSLHLVTRSDSEGRRVKRTRERGTVEPASKRSARSVISFGAICSLLVALFAFGCQLVTGDFKIEPPTQAGPGTTQCKT